MSIFVFDIETVPDIAAGRRLHGFDNLTDSEAAAALFALRRQQTGNDFLRLPLQKIVAISVVLRDSKNDTVKVWSLGEADADEKELISRFYEGVKKYQPTLVSWNGSGFDMPVLNYRSLVHGITAPHYWEVGDKDSNFRYNNYLSRYHWRHIDLMDVLALYQARACAGLDEVATLLGFPGKLDMSGAGVWEKYQRGEIDAIRNYCETDVLNTYLIYLRFELLRGKYDETSYRTECLRVKTVLQQKNKPHFAAFLQAWKNCP